MRIKLNLETDLKVNFLPINYQFEVSSWIYKTLYQTNESLRNWLMENGYGNEKKKYKLFTFSSFNINQYLVMGDRLRILSPKVELIITFVMNDTVKDMLKNAFLNQYFTIGDRKSKAGFTVSGIEFLLPPPCQSGTFLNTLSPLCIAKPVVINGRTRSEYLSPTHPEFQTYFFESLKRKFINSQKESSDTAINEDIDASQWRIEVAGNPKSRLIKIKTGTPQESQIRGFMFSFVLHANEEIIKFGTEAGFGENNSLGFGCVG